MKQRLWLGPNKIYLQKRTEQWGCWRQSACHRLPNPALQKWVLCVQGVIRGMRRDFEYWFSVYLIYFTSTLTSVQFNSVAQSCPTLCDPMNRSPPGLPVHHLLLEFTQTHIHQVSDAIQPSHPLSSPSPPAPNPSQHQSLFQWVNSSHEVAKVLEFQLWHHSFQRNPRADLLQNGLVRVSFLKISINWQTLRLRKNERRFS